MSRDDWPRLGRLVRERREALRLTQGAGGLSPSTWRNVEKAIDPPFRRVTLLAIAETLRWTPESIDEVLEGGDPVELDDRGVAPTSRSVEERLDILEDEVARLRKAGRG